MPKKIKKAVKKVVRKSKTLEGYSIAIKIMGKTFTAQGSTIKEALCNLKVGNAKGISLLTVSKGTISRTKVLTPPQTFRLFTPSRIMHEVALKQISLLFDF